MNPDPENAPVLQVRKPLTPDSPSHPNDPSREAGGDNGEIRRTRQARHIRVNRHPVEALVMPVHQQQFAAELGAAQVAQDDGADGAGAIGGAGQRDRTGFEQLVEVADGHCATLGLRPRLCHRGNGRKIDADRACSGTFSGRKAAASRRPGSFGPVRTGCGHPFCP